MLCLYPNHPIKLIITFISMSRQVANKHTCITILLYITILPALTLITYIIEHKCMSYL